MPTDGEQPKVDLIHQDPGKPTLVTDNDAARELATLEAKKGRDAALAREKELAIGLTQEQQNNLQAIDLLVEKYPQALIRVDGKAKLYDKKGRPFIVSKPDKDVLTLVVTQNGVAELTGNYYHTQPLDLDNLNPENLSDLGRFTADTVCGNNFPSENQSLPGIVGNNHRESLIVAVKGYNVTKNPGRIKDIMARTQEKFKDDSIQPPAAVNFLDEL